jgi:methionyl-tRNA formyltransferase
MLSVSKKVKVLFFGRSNCKLTDKALRHLLNLNFAVTFIESKKRGENLLKEIGSWQGDYIFCFRSFYIVPDILLRRVKIASINFHPGPPEYPGSGCINFALYENSINFGVTCHLMTKKIDDGKIIQVRRFPISINDDVCKLLKKTHIELLTLFIKVTGDLSIKGKKFIDDSIKASKCEKWSGKKRPISEINKLSLVKTNMSKDELERIIRATYTKNYPPKIIFHGYEFFLKTIKKNSKK